jgi:hypothetical protein
MQEEYILIKLSELDNLMDTLHFNTFYETVRNCYEGWGVDMRLHDYPPSPEINTRVLIGKNEYVERYRWK